MAMFMAWKVALGSPVNPTPASSRLTAPHAVPDHLRHHHGIALGDVARRHAPRYVHNQTVVRWRRLSPRTRLTARRQEAGERVGTHVMGEREIAVGVARGPQPGHAAGGRNSCHCVERLLETLSEKGASIKPSLFENRE